MIASALAILLLPLLAFIVIVFVTWKLKFLSAAVGITAIGIAILLSFFIGWELVGLCSYLLIGFWYDRTARRGVHLLPPWVAAKKAFITTRVGDVGFLIGLVILWNAGGTLQLSELFDQADSRT